MAKIEEIEHMTAKPFDIDKTQREYLLQYWSPEFYEGVERMVRERARVFLNTLRDINHYVVGRRGE